MIMHGRNQMISDKKQTNKLKNANLWDLPSFQNSVYLQTKLASKHEANQGKKSFSMRKTDSTLNSANENYLCANTGTCV